MAEGLIMTDDKKGGAAFPHVSTHMDRTGMTLRDYFAGQALVAILRYCLPRHINDPNGNAEMAYRAADAMIAEREKGGE
jgi:hypothetical protein